MKNLLQAMLFVSLMLSGCLLVSDPKIKVSCSIPSGGEPVLAIKRNYIISSLREITFWKVSPDKPCWAGGGDDNLLWKIKFADIRKKEYRLEFGNLGGDEGFDVCTQLFPADAQAVGGKMKAGEAFRVNVGFEYDHYFGPTHSSLDFYIFINENNKCNVIEYNYINEYNRVRR